MRWLQVFDDDSFTVETLPAPNQDQIIHTLQDCVCGPTEGVYNGEQGVAYWNLIHHPLIGREKST